MGFEGSISSLIKSAKLERDRIIEEIDYIVNYRFVELLQDSQAIVESYNRIKEMFGLEVDLQNTMLDFLHRNSINLKEVSKKLSKIEISEENLISEVEDFIGNSQQLLEKMDSAIKEAKENLLKSLEKQIEEAKNKEEVEIIIEEEVVPRKRRKIIVEDVEDREKEEIRVEDVKILYEETAIIQANNKRKSFLERMKAKLMGEKPVIVKKSEKAKENIK